MSKTYEVSLGPDTNKNISITLRNGQEVAFHDEVGDVRGTVEFAPKPLEHEKDYVHMFTHAAYGADVRDGVCFLVTEENGNTLAENEQYYRVVSLTELAHVGNEISNARLALEIDAFEEPEGEHPEV